MRLSLFSRCLFFLGPLALLAAGCSGGSKKGEVTGKVNLDGKALGYGVIRFINPGNTKEKGDVTADIIDGEYTVKKVPVGDIKVTVDTESLRVRLAEIPQIKANLKSQQDTKTNQAKMAKDKGLTSDIDSATLDEQIAKLKADLDKLETIQKKLPPKGVPKKYSEDKTTTITVKVNAGSNTPDPIELSSK